jgi:hypothetical protein
VLVMCPGMADEALQQRHVQPATSSEVLHRQTNTQDTTAPPAHYNQLQMYSNPLSTQCQPHSCNSTGATCCVSSTHRDGTNLAGDLCGMDVCC